MTKYCSHCGSRLEENACFCTECGQRITQENTEDIQQMEKLQQLCEACGQQIPLGSTSCPHCGAQVTMVNLQLEGAQPGSVQVVDLPSCKVCGAVFDPAEHPCCPRCGTPFQYLDVAVYEDGSIETEAVAPVCPYCGEPSREQVSFCRHCGRKL